MTAVSCQGHFWPVCVSVGVLDVRTAQCTYHKTMSHNREVITAFKLI